MTTGPVEVDRDRSGEYLLQVNRASDYVPQTLKPGRTNAVRQLMRVRVR